MALSKLTAKIYCIVLLLIPFIVFKGYYEGPKVFFLWGIGIILIIFWLTRIIYFKKELTLTKTDLWYWLFIAALTISSIFGVHPIESIVGGSLRHQGVIFFIGTWLIFKTVKLLSSSQKLFLHKGLALAILAQTLIVFLQFSFGQLYFGRPLGTIGESNAVAGFLAIGTYYVFKSADILLYAIPVMSILIAESRTGLLVLIPNLFYLIKNRKPLTQKLLGSVLVLSVLFFVWSITNIKAVSFYENRGLILTTGFKEFIKSPIIGYGAESGEVVYKKAFNNSGINLEGLVIDRSHNLFLDVLMWSGITGMLAFCGFLVNFYIGLNNRFKKLAFISFLIYAFFQPVSITHYLLIFLL